jgi:hypothetical protein
MTEEPSAATLARVDQVLAGTREMLAVYVQRARQYVDRTPDDRDTAMLGAAYEMSERNPDLPAVFCMAFQMSIMDSIAMADAIAGFYKLETQ